MCPTISFHVSSSHIQCSHQPTLASFNLTSYISIPSHQHSLFLHPLSHILHFHSISSTQPLLAPTISHLTFPFYHINTASSRTHYLTSCISILSHQHSFFSHLVSHILHFHPITLTEPLLTPTISHLTFPFYHINTASSHTHYLTSTISHLTFPSYHINTASSCTHYLTYYISILSHQHSLFSHPFSDPII